MKTYQAKHRDEELKVQDLRHQLSTTEEKMHSERVKMSNEQQAMTTQHELVVKRLKEVHEAEKADMQA
jgi:hypothetical protein